MPINYRKNNINYQIEYYPNISDLNRDGVSQINRFNLRINGTNRYIGLVNPTDPQASDIAVRIGGQTFRLAKISTI